MLQDQESYNPYINLERRKWPEAAPENVPLQFNNAYYGQNSSVLQIRRVKRDNLPC